MQRDTIIFDLDGTLLNTLDDLHACFNYAISVYGYPKRSLDEIRNFVGNGIKKAIERALPDNVSDEERGKIVDFFREYYKEHMFEHTKPYNGITKMLDSLKRHGYKLAVVSNKYDIAVKGLVKKYFGDYISIAVGEGEGINKKPEPDGVHKAIKELNSSLETSVYIGDSDVDIETADNAGIPCINVLWGFRDKEFLKAHGAKFFAEEPDDILKIIKEL